MGVKERIANLEKKSVTMDEHKFIIRMIEEGYSCEHRQSDCPQKTYPSCSKYVNCPARLEHNCSIVTLEDTEEDE